MEITKSDILIFMNEHYTNRTDQFILYQNLTSSTLLKIQQAFNKHRYSISIADALEFYNLKTQNLLLLNN